jgi:hypothetical protein
LLLRTIINPRTADVNDFTPCFAAHEMSNRHLTVVNGANVIKPYHRPVSLLSLGHELVSHDARCKRVVGVPWGHGIMRQRVMADQSVTKRKQSYRMTQRGMRTCTESAAESSSGCSK